MRIDSPNDIFVLTTILINWSITRIAMIMSTDKRPSVKNSRYFLILSSFRLHQRLRAFFDSTLSVAWGTARKRSFGISSPVIRSIP